MNRWSWLAITLLVIALIVWLEPSGTMIGLLRGEPFFGGEPASQWATKLSSDDPAERDLAFHALNDGGPEAVSVLQHLLRQAKAPVEVRWTAAELIGKLGSAGRPAAPALIQALRDSDQHVRSVAAKSLAAIEAPADQAVGPLTKLLQRDATVDAARALSAFGSDAAPALPRLVDMLKNKSLDVDVRWNAARTIGKLKAAGAPAVKVLIAALEDPEDAIREHAAEALGDIGPDAAAAVPALTKTLGDSFFKARRDAVRSLGQIGAAAQPARPEIEKLLDDPEAIVRDAARTALEQIGT